MTSASAASVVVRPVGPVDARPTIPGSKSITNRALLLAAIARGDSSVRGWLDAEDSRLMIAALRSAGVAIFGDADPDGALTIVGSGGPLPAAAAPLFVGTAGTVARFLLAVAAASKGELTLDGTPRMRERPMGALVDALREQGASIRALGVANALPLVTGPHTHALAGGDIRLPRPASSQFVSALAFGATLAATPTRIVLEQGTPARPYVDMTLAMIRDAGGDARWIDDATIAIAPGGLVGRTWIVEPDASAASYFLALAAIRGGRCTIANLGRASLQGDAAFAHVLAKMGAKVTQDASTTTLEGTGRLRGGTFDLCDMPDMTLTLAVAALVASGPTRIEGVGILRHHESDRLAAAATELRKLGAHVDVEDDAIAITPPQSVPPHRVAIDTYEDHRMAMAFALAGDVEIRAAACVGKTFPRYFDELAALGMVRES
jgi:3-phosphoshikimate 1-carboxyvinyltransferase